MQGGRICGAVLSTQSVAGFLQEGGDPTEGIPGDPWPVGLRAQAEAGAVHRGDGRPDMWSGRRFSSVE